MSREQEYTCAKCGEYYTLDPELEPTRFCNLCAQTILERITKLVPEPPNAITYECGVEILDALQKELFS